VNANLSDIDRLLRAGDGVITRRAHPDLADTLRYLVRRGRLRTILPGVYVDTDVPDTPMTKMRAVAAWDLGAVLIGGAAARLTFWAEAPVDQISAAVRCRRQPRRGFAFSKREIPVELTTRVHQLRCPVPALTALDLCSIIGGEAIDAALRSRTTTVSALHEVLALTAGRPGNIDRRRLLLESRDNAWSPAEREAHRVFHAEGLTGWVGNPLPLLGIISYLDIAFPDAKLAIEIDGRAFHGDAVAFVRDRWRQNDIVLCGWRVLRFTAEMVSRQPQVVVAVVRRALQNPFW
jgi:hypothetical protein